MLVFKPTIIDYLPENLKASLYDDIAKVVDPDKPSSLTEILKKMMDQKNWEKYREAFVSNTIKS